MSRILTHNGKWVVCSGRVVIVADGDDCPLCGECPGYFKATPCGTVCLVGEIYVCSTFTCATGSGDVIQDNGGICYSVDRQTEYLLEELPVGAVIVSGPFDCREDCDGCPGQLWYAGEPCSQCQPNGPTPWITCQDFYTFLNGGDSFVSKIDGECWRWRRGGSVWTNQEPANVVGLGPIYENCCDCCEDDCAPEDTFTRFQYRFVPDPARPGWVLPLSSPLECCCLGLVEGSGSLSASQTTKDSQGRVLTRWSLSASGGTYSGSQNVMVASGTGTVEFGQPDGSGGWEIVEAPVGWDAQWRCDGGAFITWTVTSGDYQGVGGGLSASWPLLSVGGHPVTCDPAENPQGIVRSGGHQATCTSVAWTNYEARCAFTGNDRERDESFSASWSMQGDGPCLDGAPLTGGGASPPPPGPCLGCGEGGDFVEDEMRRIRTGGT